MLWFLRSLSAFFSALSWRAALTVGRGLGRFFGGVIRYHRRDANDALARAFPERSESERERLLDRMYENLGMNLVESLRLRRHGRAYVQTNVVWENRDLLQGVYEQGRGVLLLTAHTGNWELLCATMPVLGFPLTIVAKPIKNKALHAYTNEVREQFGLKVLPSQGSYRGCLRALQRGDLLGFVLDQNMIRREGVFVDFLGRPACTTAGLAHLAARTGVPVVPMFAERRADGMHVLHIRPPLAPPPDMSEASLQAATQRYTAEIECFVREHPDQWIWIHRRWRTVPPEAGVAESAKRAESEGSDRSDRSDGSV